jgi:hypothetical protein
MGEWRPALARRGLAVLARLVHRFAPANHLVLSSASSLRLSSMMVVGLLRSCI